MSLPYNQITRGQARTDLAALLDDSNYVYWQAAELNQYLDESLRTWSAYTGYYRSRVGLRLDGSQFYDLTLPGVLDTDPLVPVLTDSYVFSQLEYSLLEPPTTAAWTGTAQFDYRTLLAALNRARDRFLVDSGLLLNRILVPAPVSGAPAGRTILPHSLLDLRRAAWSDAGTGLTTALWREDQWTIDNYDISNLQQSATPEVYSLFPLPQLEIQVSPPPLNDGVLDLLAVSSGVTLNPAIGVKLGVPDDFAWGVKFAALADLLSREGESFDPQRAQYCESRYGESVRLARIYNAVVSAQYSNRVIQVATVYEQDNYNSRWQNPATVWVNGTILPDLVIAGYNLVSLSPLPSDTPSTITLDLITPAVVPADDGAFLQISLSEYDAILQYARHLATFKTGGAEFMAGISGYQLLVSQAITYNARLRANTLFLAVLKQSLRGDSEHPRLIEPKQPAPVTASTSASSSASSSAS